MGTSFIQYKNHGFWARDTSLEVWLHYLTMEIDQMNHAPPWLIEAKELWHIQATAGFIGCISPDLDGIVSEPDRKNMIIQISKNALERFMTQGNVLDKEYLNSLGTGGAGSVFTRDCETSLFTIIGEKFIELLEGRLATDARSSPVF